MQGFFNTLTKTTGAQRNNEWVIEHFRSKVRVFSVVGRSACASVGIAFGYAYAGHYLKSRWPVRLLLAGLVGIAAGAGSGKYASEIASTSERANLDQQLLDKLVDPEEAAEAKRYWEVHLEQWPSHNLVALLKARHLEWQDHPTTVKELDVTQTSRTVVANAYNGVMHTFFNVTTYIPRREVMPAWEELCKLRQHLSLLVAQEKAFPRPLSQAEVTLVTRDSGISDQAWAAAAEKRTWQEFVAAL
jgi:hypothetical protein